LAVPCFKKFLFIGKKKTKIGWAPTTYELTGQKLTTSGRPILGSCDHLLTCTLRSPADEGRPGQSCIADGGVVLHAVTESVAMQRISRTPYLSLKSVWYKYMCSAIRNYSHMVQASLLMNQRIVHTRTHRLALRRDV